MNAHQLVDLCRARFRECVIVGSGPSADEVEIRRLIMANPNAMVIALKQAIAMVPWCDYHLYNVGNLEHFDYNHLSNRPIVIGCRSSFLVKGHTEHFDKVYKDGEMVVFTDEYVRSGGKYHKTIGAELEPADFLLDRRRESLAHGPGILSELALPLALHSGAAHVILTGVTSYDLDSCTGDFEPKHAVDMSMTFTQISAVKRNDVIHEQQAVEKYNKFMAKNGVAMLIHGKSFMPKSIRRIA